MEFIAHVLSFGFNFHDIGQTLLRVAIGVFFACSGFNKLFHPERHQSLKSNLIKNRIWCVPVMVWWVAAWEFASGIMLALGLFSAFNAAVLLIVCIVAFKCEAKHRVAAFKPINKADVMACYLYLQETLYVLILVACILGGMSAYSLDALIWK